MYFHIFSFIFSCIFECVRAFSHIFTFPVFSHMFLSLAWEGEKPNILRQGPAHVCARAPFPSWPSSTCCALSNWPAWSPLHPLGLPFDFMWFYVIFRISHSIWFSSSSIWLHVGLHDFIRFHILDNLEFCLVLQNMPLPTHSFEPFFVIVETLVACMRSVSGEWAASE